MAEASDGLTVVISGDISQLRSALSEASRLSGDFARDLTNGFVDAAAKGQTLTETMQRLLASLSADTLRAALAPLSEAFGSGLTSLLAGAGIGGLTVPFANGGVIASPIGFPLGGGQMGIAGEAGPEAIMPLTRDSEDWLRIATFAVGLLSGLAGLVLVTMKAVQQRREMRQWARKNPW